MPESLLEVVSSPSVAYISKEAKIGVGVIIGICGSITLAMFCFIVAHRNHRVMTLAQGGLLGWLTACSFFTIILACFFLPTKDSFCRINTLALLPCTMMANIMVGRLFRVYTTLSKANTLGRNSSSSGVKNGQKRRSIITEQRVMAFLGFLAFSQCWRKRNSSGGRNRPSLHQVTTRAEAVRLILVLSFPQCFIQIFSASFYDSTLILEFDESGQTGRQTCDDGGRRWLRFAANSILALQYIFTLLVAWFSRELPTAFNETSQIFRATAVNAIVSLVIIFLQLLFDLPTTSPDMTVSHRDELILFAPSSVFLNNLDCTQPALGAAQSEYGGDNRNGFELVCCGSENSKGSERREGCDFKYVAANESHRSEPSIGGGCFC